MAATTAETKPLLLQTKPMQVFVVSQQPKPKWKLWQILLLILCAAFAVRSFGRHSFSEFEAFGAAPIDAPFSATKIESLVGGATTAAVSRGPVPKVEWSVFGDNSDAIENTKVEAVVENSVLRVTVTYPKNAEKFRLRTELDVVLPDKSLDAFSLSGSVASLKYDGPNVVGEFSINTSVGSSNIFSSITPEAVHVVQRVGSVRFSGRLESRIVTLHANTGSIHVADAVVSEHIELEANTGSVEATVSGSFTGLVAHADTGSINLDLSPSFAEGSYDIKANTGSIRAKTTGFQGSFKASSSLGSVKVSGPEVHNGRVGNNPAAKGSFVARSSLGSVTLNFF
ncbi:hypothetical protein HDU79_009211 [Rhizoclosmatium sp. JEL0117]|nr:hypothetical protein HDU79_009211 [Rhizoclosmatium sp. JEL0117]